MKIKSKYFTLEELTRTNTGLLNIPAIKEVANLQDLVTNILDPLRELYGHPIIVGSGYRSPRVNTAVKGSSSSHHVKGMAADIEGFDKSKVENKKLYELIKNNFKFTQLINERNFS